VGKTGQIPVLPTLSPASGNNQLVGVGFQVMIVVTELVADHDQTLGVVGTVVLPGHGNTAMQPDALLGHVACGAVDDELGGGQLGAALGAVGVVSQAGGEDGHGGGAFQFADHVDHAVLQYLELADRHAELLAGLQVVQGQVAGNAHGAHRFTAQGGNGAAALVADGVIGFTGGAQQLAFDVVQEQLAALAAINGGVHAT